MDLMVLYRLEPLPSTTYVASVQGQPTKPITAACSHAGLQPGCQALAKQAQGARRT